MPIEETFLQLTKYTYTGREEEMLSLLPAGIQQDAAGNFFIQTGDSNTMFTCHLDTVAQKAEWVNHRFFPEKETGDRMCGTDGTTILGADDKAGMTVMLYMIRNTIPGLYYFFMDEEIGRKGSKQIAHTNPEFFRKYQRCISFDRKGYHSVITHQKNERTCSQAFADALCKQFNRQGFALEPDPTGICTDSYSFISLIPECTNISTGHFDAHHTREVQNMDFLEKLCEAVLAIAWERLPVARNCTPPDTPSPLRPDKGKYGYSDEQLRLTFSRYNHFLKENMSMHCLNADYFEPEKEMLFESFHYDGTISLYVLEDNRIRINDEVFNTMEELRAAILGN